MISYNNYKPSFLPSPHMQWLIYYPPDYKFNSYWVADKDTRTEGAKIYSHTKEILIENNLKFKRDII